MKPNNEFTREAHRFFYPVNGEVEHYESIDTENLPGVEHIPGEDHYVVFKNSTGIRQAGQLYYEGFDIPAGASIEGIRGFSKNASASFRDNHHIREANFDVFDPDAQYAVGENDQLIVMLNLSEFFGTVSDERFDEKGIAILPANEPLPDFISDGVAPQNTKYALLGFINPNDKFTTWKGPTSYVASMVDWSVANALVQNRLEQALLHDALPLGAHLRGMLNTYHGSATYLRYYDTKHETHFMPDDDPRYAADTPEFPPLSDTEYDVYQALNYAASLREDRRAERPPETPKYDSWQALLGALGMREDQS